MLRYPKYGYFGTKKKTLRNAVNTVLDFVDEQKLQIEKLRMQARLVEDRFELMQVSLSGAIVRGRSQSDTTPDTYTPAAATAVAQH
ncbi:hypothetical protein MBANPS3_008286 [Mucor bainieri]